MQWTKPETSGNGNRTVLLGLSARIWVFRGSMWEGRRATKKQGEWSHPAMRGGGIPCGWVARKKATWDFILLFLHTHPYPLLPIKAISNCGQPGQLPRICSAFHRCTASTLIRVSGTSCPATAKVSLFSAHTALRPALGAAFRAILLPRHRYLKLLQEAVPLRVKAKGLSKAYTSLRFRSSHFLTSFQLSTWADSPPVTLAFLRFLTRMGHEPSPPAFRGLTPSVAPLPTGFPGPGSFSVSSSCASITAPLSSQWSSSICSHSCLWKDVGALRWVHRKPPYSDLHSTDFNSCWR